MLQLAVFAMLVIVAAKAIATTRAAAPAPAWLDVGEGEQLDASFVDEPSQEPDLFDQAMINMDPRSYLPANVSPDVAAANLRATIDTIRWCEGTAGPNGYRMMFGGELFDDYSDHPRQFFPFTDLAGKRKYSSAAGAGQIIVKTWDAVRARLGLPDFSPASQDLAIVELIRECGALEDAKAGRIQAVARKCRAVWASLPNSNVDQPTRSLDQVIAAFQRAGGSASA